MHVLDLSIIIISYNTRALLNNCIKSIYNTTKALNYEIIVVDNASSDGSPKMIEAEFREIKLKKNKENLGFAVANNQAMKIARGRYFLLLNSDTIVKKGTIEKLISFMNEHPNAAAAGPKVLNFDGTLQSKGFYFPSIFISIIELLKLHRLIPNNIKRLLLPRFYWHENKLKKVDWLSGCCLMMSREVVAVIGVLSGDFFMYGEDLEWCHRAKANGFDVWYVPTSQVKHLNQGSELVDIDEHFLLSGKVLCEKTLGLFRCIIITILTILSLSIKFLFYKIFSKADEADISEKIRKTIRERMKFLTILKGSIKLSRLLQRT